MIALLLLLVLCIGSQVAAQDQVKDTADDSWEFSGTGAVFAKFNTNLDLSNGEATGAGTKEAFISEPTANLQLAKS